MTNELKTMAKAGNKVPYSMRLDKDLIEDLEKEAADQNRSVANLIDTILMHHYKAQPWSKTHKKTVSKPFKK